MRWQEFLNKRQAYKKAWDDLKEEHDEDVRKFLHDSYLVIAYGHNMAGQFDFKNKDAGSIAMEHPDFFVKDASGNRLIDLVRQYKAIKDQDTDLKSKIMKQLEGFDTKSLNVVENQVEIRFPALNIDFIQKIKKSKHCDKNMTIMSKDSIRIILRANGS